MVYLNNKSMINNARVVFLIFVVILQSRVELQSSNKQFVFFVFCAIFGSVDKWLQGTSVTVFVHAAYFFVCLWSQWKSIHSLI